MPDQFDQFAAKMREHDMSETAISQFHRLYDVWKADEGSTWIRESDVEPLTHIFPIKNVFREDVVLESTPKEELLKNAPKEKDGQFLVPKTIG